MLSDRFATVFGERRGASKRDRARQQQEQHEHERLQALLALAQINPESVLADLRAPPGDTLYVTTTNGSSKIEVWPHKSQYKQRKRPRWIGSLIHGAGIPAGATVVGYQTGPQSNYYFITLSKPATVSWSGDATIVVT